MKKTVYLIVTRENKEFLDQLDGFISFIHYEEREKISCNNDVGKIETPICTFRFCYYHKQIICLKYNEEVF